MNTLKTFTLSILILILAGCGGANPTPAKKQTTIPKWVYSIPPSDNQKIFGLAIGKDREAAIQAALNNMISKLGITIESSFERNETFSHSYLKVSDKSVIKANISKIKINNYKVIKSYRLNYKEFAVLLETDKQVLAKGLRDDLKIKKNAIIQKKNALTDTDILTKYNGMKNLQKEAEALMPTILILSELDKNFDKDANINFISDIKQDFLLMHKNLKFYVFGDKKSTKFVDQIKNYLAQNNFNIAESKQSAILIKLSTTDNIRKSNSLVVTIVIKIAAYDSAKYLGGKSVIIKERYTSSENNIYKNASIHFMKDIKSMGINKVLGINLNTSQAN